MLLLFLIFYALFRFLSLSLERTQKLHFNLTRIIISLWIHTKKNVFFFFQKRKNSSTPSYFKVNRKSLQGNYLCYNSPEKWKKEFSPKNTIDFILILIEMKWLGPFLPRAPNKISHPKKKHVCGSAFESIKCVCVCV